MSAPNAALPAHQQNRTQWAKANHPGVEQPHICEISPMQYGLLGKAARVRYDRKRAAEWSAWEMASLAYSVAVIADYDAGVWTAPTQDAADVVRYELARRANTDRKRRADEETARRIEAERVTAETLRVGDRVRWLGSEYVVAKVNRKTAGIRPGDEARVYTAPIQLLSRVLDEVSQ